MHDHLVGSSRWRGWAESRVNQLSSERDGCVLSHVARTLVRSVCSVASRPLVAALLTEGTCVVCQMTWRGLELAHSFGS